MAQLHIALFCIRLKYHSFFYFAYRTACKGTGKKRHKRKGLRYHDPASQNINSMRYDALNHAQGYPSEEVITPILPPAFVVRREFMFSQACVCSRGYPLVPAPLRGGEDTLVLSLVLSKVLSQILLEGKGCLSQVLKQWYTLFPPAPNGYHPQDWADRPLPCYNTNHRQEEDFLVIVNTYHYCSCTLLVIMMNTLTKV